MGIVWELGVCVCVCEHNRQFDAIVCRGVKVFGMASFLAQTFTRLHVHEINVILHKHSLTPVCVDPSSSESVNAAMTLQ